MSSPAGPDHEFVELAGHRIAYRDTGAGERTLLLVHGNPVSGHVYAGVVERLPDRYRCVVPDLLGFGASDKPPHEADYSLEKHVDVVAGLVAELDLEDVVLVGHDWGGPVGIAAALRETDRYAGLVMLNTLTEAPVRIPRRYWLPFHVMRHLEPVGDYVLKKSNLFQRLAVSDMDEADRAVYHRANDSPADRAGIASFVWMIPYDRDHRNYPFLADLLADLEAWDVPTLVLFSNEDVMFSEDQGRRLADRMENARFEVVDGAWHFLQYERPDAVAGAIEAFVEGLSPADAEDPGA